MKSFAVKLLPYLACVSLLDVLATDDACAKSRRVRHACRGGRYSGGYVTWNQLTTGSHTTPAIPNTQPVCPPEVIARLYEQTESIVARDISRSDSNIGLVLVVAWTLSRFEIALQAQLANAVQAGDQAKESAARDECLQYLRKVETQLRHRRKSSNSTDTCEGEALLGCAIALLDPNQGTATGPRDSRDVMNAIMKQVEVNAWEHQDKFSLVYALRLAAATRVSLGDQALDCQSTVLRDTARTLHKILEQSAHGPFASVLKSEYLHAVAWHAEAEIALSQGDQAAGLAAVRRALRSTKMVEAAEAEWETSTLVFTSLVERLELRNHLLALELKLEHRAGLAELLERRANRYQDLVTEVIARFDLSVGDDGRDGPLSRCLAGLAEFQSRQYRQNASCYSP